MPNRATPGIQPASPTQPTAEAVQLAMAAALFGGSPSPCTMPISSESVIWPTRESISLSVRVPCPHGSFVELAAAELITGLRTDATSRPATTTAVRRSRRLFWGRWTLVGDTVVPPPDVAKSGGFTRGNGPGSCAPTGSCRGWARRRHGTGSGLTRPGANAPGNGARGGSGEVPGGTAELETSRRWRPSIWPETDVLCCVPEHIPSD